MAVELTEDNHRQFFIPKGFAHGFAVLSETAVFQYKCDEFYYPEADGGISILDDSLGIDWKIPTEHANLSEKDTKHAMLKDFDSPFDINVDLYNRVFLSPILDEAFQSGILLSRPFRGKLFSNRYERS